MNNATRIIMNFTKFSHLLVVVCLASVALEAMPPKRRKVRDESPERAAAGSAMKAAIVAARAECGLTKLSAQEESALAKYCTCSETTPAEKLAGVKGCIVGLARERKLAVLRGAKQAELNTMVTHLAPSVGLLWQSVTPSRESYAYEPVPGWVGAEINEACFVILTKQFPDAGMVTQRRRDYFVTVVTDCLEKYGKLPGFMHVCGSTFNKILSAGTWSNIEGAVGELEAALELDKDGRFKILGFGGVLEGRELDLIVLDSSNNTITIIEVKTVDFSAYSPAAFQGKIDGQLRKTQNAVKKGGFAYYVYCRMGLSESQENLLVAAGISYITLEDVDDDDSIMGDADEEDHTDSE